MSFAFLVQVPLSYPQQAWGEDYEGSNRMGTFTLFTDVALVAVGPDAATAVAL